MLPLTLTVVLIFKTKDDKHYLISLFFNEIKCKPVLEELFWTLKGVIWWAVFFSLQNNCNSIVGGQSKDKRMASWKVYVFQNGDNTQISWENNTFKYYCNFLMESYKAFYQQGDIRFLLAWKEATFGCDSTPLLSAVLSSL